MNPTMLPILDSLMQFAPGVTQMGPAPGGSAALSNTSMGSRGGGGGVRPQQQSGPSQTIQGMQQMGQMGPPAPGPQTPPQQQGMMSPNSPGFVPPGGIPQGGPTGMPPNKPMGMVGPPKVSAPAVIPMEDQLAYAKAMREMEYLQAPSGNGIEAFIKNRNADKVMRNFLEAQQKISGPATQRKMEELQRNTDAVYTLAVKATGDPMQAKAIATAAMNDPSIIPDLAKELYKQETGQMQQDYEFVQGIEDDAEREKMWGIFQQKYGPKVSYNLPAGYRMKPNGDMEEVPGGPAWWERMEKQQMIHMQNLKAQDKVDNAIRQVKRSIKLVGPGTTGLIGALMGSIPGTDARNLRELLINQQANIAFEALKDMREASRTGGALGNVSNREIELLYNSFAALSTQMDDEQLNKSLMDVLMKYEGTRYALRNENEFLEQGLTPSEMRERINEHVNQQMRRETNVPESSWEKLMEDPTNPENLKNFEARYGWMPRTTDDWTGYQP